MKPPQQYYDTITEITTCSVCGKSKQYNTVLISAGQNTGIIKCLECTNKEAQENRAKYKSKIAKMPRCEIPGCNHRANYTAGYKPFQVGICGRHLKTAQSNIQSSGIMGLFADQLYREDIIKLAQKCFVA